MDARQEVVRLAFQHVVMHDQSRRDQLCDAAFDQPFRLLGVFQLVANRHLESGFDKLGQIRVQAVVREPSQFHFRGAAVAPFGQHDAQDVGGIHRVGTKGLVEVAHAKQQHGVRMLGFDPVVLLHQGRLFLGHGLGFIQRRTRQWEDLESIKKALSGPMVEGCRYPQGVHTPVVKAVGLGRRASRLPSIP